MKIINAILLISSLVVNFTVSGAQTQTNESQQKALEVLRETLRNLETNTVTRAKPSSGSLRDLAYPLAERQFIEGKMSAKEFQRYLDDHNFDPANLPRADAQKRALEVLHDQLSKPAPTAQNLAQPVTPAPAPEDAGLVELENKMDRLLQLKAARESGAATNALSKGGTNAAAPAAPLSKRDRLNELLRLVVAGKLTDAEYKEQRSKIMSEPESR